MESDVNYLMTKTPAPTHTRPSRQITLLFIGLMLAMLLASLNQTVLSTALPTIVGELDGVDVMPWVITSYILAATIVMPVYGRIGDQIGRKPLLMTAIVLFMVGAITGGVAQNIWWLIAGRGIQGLGGGGLMLLSQAIIADVVPARQRGKYMGIMGSVFAVSSVAGPLLGGWLTEGPGWRWAFWVCIPLGVLALIAAVKFMNLPKLGEGKPKLDYAGMALIAIATSSLVLAATWGGSEYDWGSVQIIGLIVAGVVAAMLFAWVETRATEPIMPPALFRDRNFVLTTTAGLLVGVSMFGVLGYMPTYLQMAAGVSATVAGLLMVPMMGTMLLTSVVAGLYVTRTGRYKWLPITGSLLIATALMLLSTMTATTPVWVLCAYIAVMGLGLGTCIQLLVLIVQNSFPAKVVGTATAANNYFRQTGASLGSAVVGNLFASRLMSQLMDKIPADEAAGVTGGASSLTPERVNEMPSSMQTIVVEAYNEALIPIFLFMIPAGSIAALLLSFVKEKKLATTIDRDEPFEEGDDEVDEDAEDAENSESSGMSRNPDSAAETVAAKKQPALS